MWLHGHQARRGGLDTTDDGHLQERIADHLSTYETDSIQAVIEDSMATALSVLVNKPDSHINLIIGKVLLHALTEPEE